MPMRTVFCPRDALGGPVGPEHPGEFLSLFALCSFQAFAQAIEDGAIVDIGLTIALK